MAQESRKSELVDTLAEARRGLSTNARGLRRDLNIVQRVETAFQRHRFVWLAGAGALGFLLSRLPARKAKVTVERKTRKLGAEEKVVKAGILVTTLKIAFDLARPALTKWVARSVANFAEERFGRDVRQ